MCQLFLRMKWLVILLYCLVFPVLSQAQDLLQRDYSDYLLSLSLEELMSTTITTASKRKENIKDTPSTVIVITKQQILTRRYINLVDLLRDLPGVDIQKASDETRYNNITLRGHLGNNKFLILQDGVRIDSPTGEIIPVADNFPLYYAKQVEIVYGPAAALYGADAFGGVVNIITEDGDSINGLELSTTVASHGYRYYHARAGGYLSEDFKLALGGHVHEADNADLSKYYPDAYAKTDATTLSGNVVIPAGEREDYYGATESRSAYAKLEAFGNFTFGLNYGHFLSPSSTGDKPSAALYDRNAIWETELTSAYGKYHFDFERLSGDTTVHYSTYEVLPSSRFNNIFTDFQDGYKYAKGRKQSIEQQFTYLLHEKHDLVVGLGYEDYYSLPRTADLPFAFVPSTPYSQQNLYYGGTDNTLPIQFLDTKYTDTSLYLQMQSHWSDKISSTIGVRYDDNSYYGSTLNPRLGFVYQPEQDTTVKLLYGRGFRAPSPHESYSVFGTFSGEKNERGEYISRFFRVPNPDLQPEEVSSWEFNVFHKISNDLHFSISGYSAKVTGLVGTSPTQINPVQFIPGGYIETGNYKDNLETERHYGLDIDVQYQHYFGNSISGSLWANYSYITGEIMGQNDIKRDLPYIAKHKLKLGATFSYKQRYFFTPKLYVIDETITNKPDPTNPNRWLHSPGYVVMDLHFGAMDVWDKLSVFVDVHNVFDTRYYNAGSITQNATFLANPQQPRSIGLTLKYTF
ncbi:TonB-dependent receptor [Candidatus Albibeggiatoa sp. nov. NOAA]|uniref:TonB-dependent receptor plug domain-containing protein n=1 Tax=Candidatus Albibeggiatoa sp. nov. NOAA TaxID=3162724 RepID=UPI0032F8BF04|nr:TonB-dependent receptor [Thiotrichaceae bacterium]